MQITIKTNNPRNHMILSADIPVGARITSQPPIETKMFDLSTTLDVAINIDLDLTKAVTSIVTAWLFKNLLQGRGKTEINFDGQNISIDQPDAQKLIEDAINQNKS